MEKDRLLELVKHHSDKEAIGMILSNYIDYGNSEKGGMLSVGQFYKVADVLIEWWAGKNEPSEKEILPTCDISGCSLEVIEKLADCNISQNHTGRWGVIFGRISRTYSFMHKEKKEVLEWIRQNYR